MRRATTVAALTAALSLPTAAALADSTVVVPGLAFPSSDTYLTYFGCVDLYHADTRSPQVRIGHGDRAVPAGVRSFDLRMPGTGTASGPVHRVESVAATTVAGFSARSDSGGAGVAYVWFVSPGLAPGQTWAGRADLQVGEGWQQVDAAGATYSWTRYEAATGEVLEEAGSATVAEFTAEHGDGPGYLLAGLGCDGQEFSLDALRFGSPGAVTTYDLEGISVTTSIRASRPRVAAGGDVTLTGTTVDGSGVPVGATLVLEARPEGAVGFSPVPGGMVHADPDGHASLTVNPDVTTTYRWARPGTGYADPGHSAEVTVEVRGSASPSAEPSASPSARHANPPSPAASPAPQASPAPTSSSSPTAVASPTPSAAVSPSPSSSPSSTASPAETASVEPVPLPSPTLSGPSPTD
jgi:hypothetical protein